MCTCNRWSDDCERTGDPLRRVVRRCACRRVCDTFGVPKSIKQRNDQLRAALASRPDADPEMRAMMERLGLTESFDAVTASLNELQELLDAPDADDE